MGPRWPLWPCVLGCEPGCAWPDFSWAAPPDDAPPGMFWADATAMPASSAAVPINSLLLIGTFLWVIPRAPSIWLTLTREARMRFLPANADGRVLTSLFSRNRLQTECAFILHLASMPLPSCVDALRSSVGRDLTWNLLVRNGAAALS